uniref:IF140/IFT172/WDR19 TPR domain-containing protein n=1 Tax=Percolomonas cosmopolitus TaxID=63605 RepID=A0A7S1KTE2_9EUKA
MQLRFLADIHQPIKAIAPIRSLAWSPNNRRLALADSNNVIYLYDENGEKKEKFSTKSVSGEKGGNSYMITGLVFSPDSTKLAVAQSDNIVYIYKLGLEWGERKSICNKFDQKNQAAVTCVTWPYQHAGEVVFGRDDGEVKIGMLKTNRGATLYAAESPCVALCSSPDGHGVLSAHADGSIHRWFFKGTGGFDESALGGASSLANPDSLIGHAKIAQHTSVPASLAWGETIICAGADKKVVFYHLDGSIVQHFDLSNIKNQQEFTSLVANPSGQSCVVGSINRFQLFNYNIRRGQWEEGERIDASNLHTVTCMAWKPDGSRLVLGNTCSGASLFDACIKRYKYRGEFEFTYVSPSQVIVKRLTSGTRIVLKSLYGYEILKVITRGKYLIGYTPKTLLLGDLESCKLSEVPWNGGGGDEKFYFENPRVCLVYHQGDVSVVEYGINEIIGSFRTDHVSPHLMSVRVLYKLVGGVPGIPHHNESPLNSYDDSTIMHPDQMEGIKRIAYLVDSHTIQILDLISSVPIARIDHDLKVDWLELNSRGGKLLFRDKSKHLYLYDVHAQEKTPLLTYCSYVQWVPESDVVVAQNRGDLCVWYSIDAPDRVTIVPIKGEVEDIVRSDSYTAVVVNEGTTSVNYALDDGLIQFGTAMEDHNYEHAADILDKLTLTPETEAMWKNLATIVMADQKYHIAERCYAALGDVSKARYLRQVHEEHMAVRRQHHLAQSNALGEEVTIAAQSYDYDPLDHWKVRAKIAILNGDFKYAEQIYLEQGKIEEALDMYQKVHRFEDSIELALAKGVPNAEERRKKYLDWLIQTGQHDKAARRYEKEGKVVKAVDQYLKGGFPSSAASLVNRHLSSGGNVHEDLLDRISRALISSNLHQKAGEFYEARQMYDEAIDAYKKGHAYRHAVELARKHFSTEVVPLEQEWADWLVSQKQLEGAVHHYIEAGQYKQALNCAIQARQWKRAEQILENLPKRDAKTYYQRIARHYEEMQAYQEARRFYLKADMHKEAMKMFEDAGMLESMIEVAETFMAGDQVINLYLEQAQRLETQHRYREAETLYLKANEPDYAINMYKKHHLFDDMIRLVAQFRKVHLKDAHVQIGQQLESEGNLRDAEQHYIEAGKWMDAVAMYRNHNSWEEAIQITKTYGPMDQWKRVAIQQAVMVATESQDDEKGAQLLFKRGLFEEAINFCLERALWNFAFDIARTSMESKIPEVHKEYAVYLEENGRLLEAEEEYINGSYPKEAIDMWIHEQDWDNAMRVAQTHDPTLINYVLEKQGESGGQMGKKLSAQQLGAGVDDADEDDDMDISEPTVIGETPLAPTYVKPRVGGASVGGGASNDTANSTTPPQSGASAEQRIEQLAKSQQWPAALQTAKDAGHTILYAKFHSQHLVKSHQYQQALQVLTEYGIPVEEQLLPMYKEIVKRILWQHPPPSNELIKQARNLLVHLDQKFKDASINTSSKAFKEFSKYVTIVHLMNMYNVCSEHAPDLDDLRLKQAVSLLRYTNLIPPDRAFCRAGEICRKQKRMDMGLVFYNRYLDISDAIDEIPEPQDPNTLARAMVELENTDFQETDIPYLVPIPRERCLSEKEHDEITNDVLVESISGSSQQSLPKRTCTSCGHSIYEAALSCSKCNTTYEPCIVTGYPVLTSTKISCTHCYKPANRNDWNSYIMKMKNCPHCEQNSLTQ